MSSSIATNTQQFILEEHLDIIVSESGGEIEVMNLKRDDFIGIMLSMHQANSSRKWRLMVKMRKDQGIQWDKFQSPRL